MDHDSSGKEQQFETLSAHTALFHLFAMLIENLGG